MKLILNLQSLQVQNAMIEQLIMLNKTMIKEIHYYIND